MFLFPESELLRWSKEGPPPMPKPGTLFGVPVVLEEVRPVKKRSPEGSAFPRPKLSRSQRRAGK